jgi:hypothetical protein
MELDQIGEYLGVSWIGASPSRTLSRERAPLLLRSKRLQCRIGQIAQRKGRVRVRADD